METTTGSPDGVAVANTLADAVNSGINSDDLVDELAAEHRWLQNEVFYEVVKPLIVSYAEREAFDQRNENAVMECREIVEQMDWVADIPDTTIDG